MGRELRSGYFGKSAVLMFVGSTRRALVVANGAAYVIEPETQKLIRQFGGGITDVLYLPDRDTMIFSDGIYLERLDADGIKWRTRRISWDGISDLAIENGGIKGVSFDAVNDCSKSFEANFETGDVIGGAYPPELAMSADERERTKQLKTAVPAKFSLK